MSIEKSLETEVEKLLETNTISGAKKIFKAKSGVITLSAISFIESALPLPLLTDPFLAAAILIDRINVNRLILATTVSSVLGGVFAYLSAAYFFDVLVHYLSPETIKIFQSIIDSNQSSIFVLSLLGAVTPIPYTIVAWVVGVIDGSLMIFILASLLGRGFRYAIVGYTTYKFGLLATTYAKKYIGLASVILILLGIIYFWVKM